ncbi:MAG: hypothetical protein KDJ35_01450 [Alphaproteobacteria bacterium]|nr:hypothetical protein [Alphaproteobacteria bacterium]
MIKVLGQKRVLMLFVLGGLNIALLAGVYLYLSPQKAQKEREQRTLRAKISAMQNDIDDLQLTFEQLETQQARFEALKDDGFFGVQNRRDAEKVLEAVQREAGVISAVASIKAGEFVDNEDAAKADYRVLSSEITVRVEALDDINVYKYLALLEAKFPGEISLKDLNLIRKSDVSATVLRAIASGENPALVQADIRLTWKTMVPNDTNNAGGSL